MPSKEAARFLLLALMVSLGSASLTFGSPPSSRFHIKRDRPPSVTSSTSRRNNFEQQQAASPRHDTGFDPDVLNRFLEEYASKIKRVGERPPNGYEDPKRVQDIESISVEADRNSDMPGGEMSTPNDTIKRHKFYGPSSQQQQQQPEDRNTGWVTLDAIPWSKSKISKWQANPTTQGPWPNEPSRPWDKPSYNKQPWNQESSRPSYDSNKPWHNKLTNKPYWTDSSSSASNKPGWYQERPQHQERPTTSFGFGSIDKFEDDPNHAQKWPPERPSWHSQQYGDSHGPSADIITANGPSDFPSNNNNNWDRPGQQRPSYTHHTESFVNEAPGGGGGGGGGGWHDRNDFPGSTSSGGNKFPQHHNNNNYNDDRPHFSQYQYPSSVSSNNVHPPSYPGGPGEGQWVLLSTNRGYSKSRQRSIKLDASLINGGGEEGAKGKRKEDRVPAVTSKRQVRLTVLPSINGTNTTTSHGGMLEVEKTFKTVDQSQREYELQRILNATLKRPVTVSKRPTRNSLAGVAPSNGAVLAAVGAGMLPATMAMMLPMMLGRKKREVWLPRRLVDELQDDDRRM